MKKKFIALGVLVAAVAVTASSVAGTYAKYTSTVAASDKARVAKWGINTTNVIDDLFGSSYILGGSEADIEGKDTLENADVIAPGAKGFYAFTIDASTAPEVAFKLGLTANVTDKTGKLKFHVAEAETPSDISDSVFNSTGSWKSAAEISEEFEALGLTTKEYKPNDSEFSALSDKNYVLYWIWDFDGVDDSADTKLGTGETKACGEGNNQDCTAAGTEAVKVEVTITAEQIQNVTGDN